MIIRKPYAFFIKNFRKIHIVLLVLSLLIIFKQSTIGSFLRDFIEMKTYDPNNFPITRYIPGYQLFFILLVLVGSIIITTLLKRKNKPWKLYLLPVITYSTLLLMDFLIRTFFLNYSGQRAISEIYLYRDILLFANFLQYPVLILFLVRILGLDLRKFNFNMDEEYLELDEDDREEIEININVDKESIKRIARRVLRHLNYFYQEHQKLCLTVAVIVGMVVLRYTYMELFVSTKKYKQNEEYNVNGYTIVVNDAYYTNKSGNGEVISANSSFVIVDLTVKNNVQPREMDTNKFHILNGISNYTTTDNTYAEEFEDLGTTYSNKEIKRDETINMIIIFKVSKKLSKDRFVLAYQEAAEKAYLRKIKIKVKDLSKIENKDMSIGDSMPIKLGKDSENIAVDEAYTTDNIRYRYKECDVDQECEVFAKDLYAPKNKKILLIEYGTDDYESKELIDFSSKYGKIIYIDSKDKKHKIGIKNPINITYLGKYSYTYVSEEIEKSKKVYLEYTIRNKKYTYKIEL